MLDGPRVGCALAERSAAFAGPTVEVACPRPAPHIARSPSRRPCSSLSLSPSPPRPRRRGPAASTLRHVGPAWQPPTADDPDRLIVTFRAGTTPARARVDSPRDAAPPGPAKLAEPRSVARPRPRPGARTRRWRRLRADPHVLRVSVDHRRFLRRGPDRRTATGTSCGVSRTPARTSTAAPETGVGRRRHRRAPGARHHDRRPEHGRRGHRRRRRLQPSRPRRPRLDEPRRIGRRPGDQRHRRRRQRLRRRRPRLGLLPRRQHRPRLRATTSTGPMSPARSRRRSNGVGVVGVAPERLDHGPQVHQRRRRLRAATPQAIAAIAYAKSFGVQIANASWGARGRPERRRPSCYDAIRTSGMLFVAAAGNDGRRQRHRPVPEPARGVRPAEHRVGRGDRQHGRPGLRSRTTARRPSTSPRPGVGHPERPACRRRASEPGLGLARRHVDGGAARDAARPRWSPRSSRRSRGRSGGAQGAAAGDRQADVRDGRGDRHGPDRSMRSGRSTRSAAGASAPIELRVRRSAHDGPARSIPTHDRPGRPRPTT